MDKNILSKMEDLQIELACTTDGMSLIIEYISDLTKENAGNAAVDGLWSIYKHFERIAENLDDLIWSAQKTKL